MTWSDDSLLISFKREYMLIQDEKQQKLILPAGNTQTVYSVLSLNGDELLMNRDSTLYCSLLLFFLKNKFLFLDTCISFKTKQLNSSNTRNVQLVCNEQPCALAYLKPFVITGLNNSIEIHVMNNSGRASETLIESIPLPGNSLKFSQANYYDYDSNTGDNGYGIGQKVPKEKDEQLYHDVIPSLRLFVATRNSVHLLVMRQPKETVRLLQENRQFLQALGVFDIFSIASGASGVNDFIVPLAQSVAQGVQVAHGLFLVVQGDFSSALNVLLEARVDPRVVIRLFPNFLPENPKWNSPMLVSATDCQVISKQLSEPSRFTEGIKTLLIPFLNKVRISAAAAADGLSEEETNIAEAIDTALLKAYALTRSDYITTFMSLPNRCNHQVGDQVIQMVSVVVFFIK